MCVNGDPTVLQKLKQMDYEVKAARKDAHSKNVTVPGTATEEEILKLLDIVDVTSRRKTKALVKFLKARGVFAGSSHAVFTLSRSRAGDYTVETIVVGKTKYNIAYAKDIPSVVQDKVQRMCDVGQLVIMPYHFNRDVTVTDNFIKSS